MLYCNHCHVHLRGAPAQCPLCQRSPVGEPDALDGAFPRLPERPYHRTLLAWLLFLSVVAAAVCVTINLIIPASGLWSLFVAGGLLSLWIALAITLKKRRNIPKTILWQVGAVSLIAFAWDCFTGYQGWSIDYVLPILCSCAMVAMLLTARVRRLHIQDYIFYLIIDCILGIVSFVLIVTGVVRIVIPSAICFGASIIVLAFLLIFNGRALVSEVQRRLHV